jgi:fermentation-respiration switch protein FrsA (DUF1100 family)
MIPLDDAKALKAASAAPLTLVTLSGLDHNDPRPDQAIDRVASFLTATVSR